MSLETEIHKDGGLDAAKEFGRQLGAGGVGQLLALASAIVAQADSMPDYSQFTAEEFELLSAARIVVQRYSWRNSDFEEIPF